MEKGPHPGPLPQAGEGGPTFVIIKFSKSDIYPTCGDKRGHDEEASVARMSKANAGFVLLALPVPDFAWRLGENCIYTAKLKWIEALG
jgi:hypothetical protein